MDIIQSIIALVLFWIMVSSLFTKEDPFESYESWVRAGKPHPKYNLTLKDKNGEEHQIYGDYSSPSEESAMGFSAMHAEKKAAEKKAAE